MSEMARRVQEKDADRLRVLQAVYEMVDGNEHAAVLMTDVYERLFVTEERGRSAIDYLRGERLLVGRTNHRVSITHLGVNEVEQSLKAPTERTEHFPAIVVNQVFHAAVGAVQTGASPVANVQQQNNLAPAEQRDAALAELDAAAESVTEPDAREQALSATRAVRKELAKPAPDVAKVTAYVNLVAALTASAPALEHVVKAFFGG